MRWLHPNSSCSISQASVNHSDTDQEHRAWAGLLISQPVQAECSSVSFSISNTIVPLACLLLDYLPDRQEEFGLSGGLQFDTVLLFPSGHQEWQEKEESPELGGTRMPDRDSYANGTGSSSGGPGGGGSEEASGTGAGSGGASSDAICRDFLRNVCIPPASQALPALPPVPSLTNGISILPVPHARHTAVIPTPPPTTALHAPHHLQRCPEPSAATAPPPPPPVRQT